MNKHGILNSHILKVLADLGHTDKIAIADCGLPIPDGVQKIDLALAQGDPSFMKIVALLQAHMAIEEVILAEEIATHNKAVHQQMQACFSDTTINYTSHEDFKHNLANVKAVIRTGEVTPYANCILTAAVIF